MADFKQLIGYKDFRTLVDEAIARLKTSGGSKVTNLNPGGVFRTLLEMSLQGVADLYKLLAEVAPQGFAGTASGPWLDLKAQEVGITRNPARKTEGLVTFFRTDAAGQVQIPAGTVVRTEAGASGEYLRYLTSVDAVLPDGALEVVVPVLAEFPGAQYNVGEGLITVLVTNIPGVEGVRNDAGWITSEGADEEDDESLRQRYFLRWSELSLGGTRQAYISWARSVPGVRDVAVDDNFPRGQGTVDVIITGTAGPPSQALIDEVQAYVDQRRPVTANVLVKAPTAQPVDVTLTVWIPADTGEVAAVQADVEAAVRALFGLQEVDGIAALRIGEDLLRARLVAIVMARQHVVNVDVASPAADVAIPVDGLATLGTLSITVLRVSA